MKLRITAIAAGLVLLSGAASAAEVLNVSQMDTVTAAGWHGEWFNWHKKDFKLDKGFDGKHHWKFGKFKDEKGREWDAKCRDERGRILYGKIKDIKDEVKKPDAPAAAPTNTATVNLEIKGDVVNSNVVLIVNLGSGNVTANPSITLPTNNKVKQDFFKHRDLGKFASRKW